MQVGRVVHDVNCLLNPGFIRDLLKGMALETQDIVELLGMVSSISEALHLAILIAKQEKKIRCNKDIYMELGMDLKKWSRMLMGSFVFPPDLIAKFCEIVGNDILIQWICLQRNLRVMPDTFEKDLIELKAENGRLKEKLAAYEEAFKLVSKGMQGVEK
jgi:hypothetical protein